MTRTTRRWWFCGTALLAFVLGHLLLRHVIILPGFSELERQHIEAGLQRTVERLGDQLVNLQRLATDYGGWDETYAMVRSPNPGYVKRNLRWAYLHEVLNIHLVTLLDNSGRVIWHGTRLPGGEPTRIPELAGEGWPDDHPLRAAGPVNGLVWTAAGPFLVAADAVTNNERTRPATGRLILGRYLSPELLDRFSSHLAESVEVRPAADGAPPLGQVAIELLSPEQIAATASLVGVDGLPAVVLRAVEARAIVARGESAARAASGALLLGLVLVILVGWRLLEQTADLELSRASAARAAEALARSEEQHRLLVETIGDCLWEATPEGIFTYCSPRVRALLGYAPEELIGRPCWELITPAEADEARATFAAAREAGQPLAPRAWSMRHRLGHEVTIERTAWPVAANGHPAVWRGLDRDVTERERVSAELRRSRALLDTMLATIPVPVYSKDRAGRYQFVNRAFGEFFGQPAEWFLGQTVEDIWPPELAARYRAGDEALLASGGERTAEAEAVLLSGERRPVMTHKACLRDEAGEVCGLVAAFIDLTALKANEHLLRTLYNHLTDMVWIHDLEGRIIELNDEAVRRLGYSREEILAGGIPLIDHPDSAALIAERIQRIVTEGKLTFEVIHVAKDGTYIPTEVRTRLIDVAGERLILSVMRDLRQARQAEVELRASRNMLQAILDTIPVRVFWKDGAGRYLGGNRHFAEDAGATRIEEVLGLTDHDMPWAEQAERYLADDREVMATGQPKLGLEEPHTTPRGVGWVRTSKVPLRDGEGAIVGVLGTYEDITAQRAAEQARLAEERFREAIIQRAAEGLCVGHTIAEFPYTEYTVWNDRMVEITGYTREEINQLGWLDALYPDPAAREEAAARMAATRAGHDLTGEELRVTAKDGSPRTLAISTTQLIDAEGQRHTLALILDRTEARRLEEERRLLDLQMQHAQKLESLGVLAGGIAHDFNNLLLAVLGNADLALCELPETSPGREYLEDIETAARRAADLCRQMLAYSGKGRFVIEVLDLHEVIEEISHMLEITISKKAVLRCNFADNLPPVRADATQLRQVIMNLITNASEALGEKSGIISLSTGAMECDEAYLRETYLDEDLDEGLYVYLEVADTGCGMDEETRERIFEPFFTTKFTGRGLGMAAVLGIVRGHGGAIKVYSELGRGTTVKVLLPACVEEVEPARAAEAAPAEAWSSSGLVLLADDEETVRVIAKRMLERLGFEVIVADDGRQALELYRQHRAELRCVVLDLTMPHLTGEEAFREMRRLDKSVRVILSSGYNEQEVEQRFLGKGLSGFIQKPYRLDTLRQVMRQVLDDGPAPAS